MSEPKWLDVMPVIPVARGVPIVVGILHYVCVGTRNNGRSIMVPRRSFAPENVRVDLEDPQGAFFAIHWIFRNGPSNSDYVPFEEMADRLLCDQFTDADRLALAKACAEIEP